MMLTRPLDLSAAGALIPGAVLHRVALPAVTCTQLAFYCAAVRVPDPIHYDREFARRFGFADLVVNGSLRISWLTRALTDLVAAPDYLGHIACAHRGPMFVGDALTIEVSVAAPVRGTDAGCELSCEVVGHSGGQLIDRADGVLVFVER